MKSWSEIIQNTHKDNFNHLQDVSFPALDYYEYPVINHYAIEEGYIVSVDLISNAAEIQKAIKSLDYKSVGADGNARNKTEDKVSGRASSYDIKVAQELNKKLQDVLPSFMLDRIISGKTVDAQGHYKFVGLNPYFRFIVYENGKKLVSHYDGHYHFNADMQTCMTCLIYLTDNTTGHTLFLKDNRSLEEKKALLGKPLEPLLSLPTSAPLVSIMPKAGRVLLFDQYLLHATSELIGEEKILILSDYVMTKIP